MLWNPAELEDWLANIKSQIKRNKQAEIAHLRNKGSKSEIKTYISKFEKTVAAGDKENAKSTLDKAIKTLDKAAAKGVIHPNNAANKKSRLAKKLNTL